MKIQGIAAAPGYAVAPIWRYVSAGISQPLEGEAATATLTISDARSAPGRPWTRIGSGLRVAPARRGSSRHRR